MATPHHHSSRFGLEEIDLSIWPKRLLRFDNMTSYPAHLVNGKHSYSTNGKKNINPKYNILSYTWGRYRTDTEDRNSRYYHQKGESIRVDFSDDVKWKIPPVSVQKFTAKHFKKVLKVVGETHNHIWLDIACIEQPGPGQSAIDDEVNNQASIFSRADTAYVWLWSMDEATLRKSVEAIISLFESPALHRHDDVGQKELEEAIRPLLDDPWFTSLWCTQEAFLRRNAIILPLGGEIITFAHRNGTQTLTLDFIMERCKALCRDRKDGASILDLNNLTLTKMKMTHIGLHDLISKNPMVLLGIAKRRETTARGPERIKAIMQVFGMKLENPAAERTQSQMELKLSFWVNKQCPPLAQAFCNRKPGRTWQAAMGAYSEPKSKWMPGIEETIYIPEEMYNAREISCKFRGMISPNNSRTPHNSPARFDGYSWRLEDLLVHWKGKPRPPPEAVDSLRPSQYSHSFAFSFYLDQYTKFASIPSQPPTVEFLYASKPLLIAHDLNQKFPNQVHIFVLGRVRNAAPHHTEQHAEQNAWVGMLTAEVSHGVFYRIGFCTWEQNEAHANFRKMSCLLSDGFTNQAEFTTSSTELRHRFTQPRPRYPGDPGLLIDGIGVSNDD